MASRPQPLRAAALVGLALAAGILLYGTRLALFVAPTEATMGNVQRIFYWHVPLAITALLFPYVNLAGSVWLLAVHNRRPAQIAPADALALAGAELSVLFTSLGLITGILWARPVWGIWWTWDARLTTYLLLWLLYVAYLLLRRFSPTGEGSTLAAILGVFAAIDVPITFMSIRWWRTQHPAPVLTGDGSLDPSMKPAFYWCLLGWFVWGLGLLALRYTLARRRQAASETAALQALDATLGTATPTFEAAR